MREGRCGKAGVGMTALCGTECSSARVVCVGHTVSEGNIFPWFAVLIYQYRNKKCIEPSIDAVHPCVNNIVNLILL